MNDITVPVLIVGAGPVGLCAALFLSGQGVDCLLVERHEKTSFVPRATGVHVRTLELFRTAGVEQAIRAAGRELVVPDDVKATVHSGNAIPRIILRATTLADIDNAIVLESPEMQPSEISPCPPIWCGQDVYEPILVDACHSRGADLRFGVELTGFTQDQEGVAAELEDRASGQHRTVRASYLIAADGVKSPVREQLQIGRAGEGSAGHAMSIMFDADLDPVLHGRRFIICYMANPAAPGILVSLDGDRRWVLAVRFQPEKGETAEDFTTERCLAAVRAVAGRADLDADIQAAFPWEAAHLVADRYRAGRVFLAGDAAHVHPPAGGFGANAGIQDAHNLAWKLAAVLNGWADESLLDTYEAERRPVGAATADQAYWRDSARIQRMSPQERGRIREYLVVILGYRYSSAAVTGAAGPDPLPEPLQLDGQPGTRAPHVWLDYSGERISAIDLFGDGFVLLSGAEADGWHAAAPVVAAQLGVPLRRHRLGPRGDLDDPDGNWHGAYGVTARGAVLVRPDGFVAWRSAGSESDQEGVLSRAVMKAVCRDQVLASNQ
jgi:2-polyprenyl-6-methoxyphenol hydroxylase-like FAD-dependent oxidoreductase